ncbi:MAG: hypothetical protein ABW022_20175 [Actinoplanes sp.]
MADSDRTRLLPTALLLAVATAATWAVWLGWESGYHTDPVTGAVSGPYAWWQVAGCVLTLAVLAAVAARRLPIWLLVPVMAVVFTVAWSIPAASTDDTGLWGVGAILVLAGTAVGSFAVAGVSKLLRR